MEAASSDKHIQFPIQWRYPVDVWEAYVKAEGKAKGEDNIYAAIGVLILGTPALMLLRGAGIWLSLAIVIPIALVFGYGRQYYVMKRLKSVMKDPQVGIGHDKLHFGRKSIEIFNRHKWISGLRIFERDGMKLLEFTCSWDTRKGPTFDEYRIPVLPEHEAEAQLLLDYFEGKVEHRN